MHRAAVALCAVCYGVFDDKFPSKDEKTLKLICGSPRLLACERGKGIRSFETHGENTSLWLKNDASKCRTPQSFGTKLEKRDNCRKEGT
ncbi:hypothetical protein EYF80_019614 [Liparis tanakae]|uniref:Uncharacterized protein n=1 Tax=Liparis tanakae TaxID=230148 RepID=A0A4Z2HYN5_9TELE|nr:hypothetical protein EYF80_019614 [Liparis tanakae]